MLFSQRIQQVQPSPTLAISSRAKALAAEGVDVISFGAGEPDFNTPEPICDAAKAALDEGHTKYTAVAGISELREALAHDYARRGRDVSPDEVMVSVGGKHALYNATQVLFEHRRSRHRPRPLLGQLPRPAPLAGAEPVPPSCPADHEFQAHPERPRASYLDETITGLILCSPSNPTGAVYSADELAALGRGPGRLPRRRRLLRRDVRPAVL